MTVVTNACAFYHTTRGCGRIERPAFPAPSIVERRKIFASLGRLAPRERGVLSFNALVIACDKREAFAQGSGSDEAIHTSGFLTVNAFVLPGLVPGIHVLLRRSHKGVDGRDEARP